MENDYLAVRRVLGNAACDRLMKLEIAARFTQARKQDPGCDILDFGTPESRLLMFAEDRQMNVPGPLQHVVRPSESSLLTDSDSAAPVPPPSVSDEIPPGAEIIPFRTRAELDAEKRETFDIPDRPRQPSLRDRRF